MSQELKKLVDQVKALQKKYEQFLGDQQWLVEAKEYALKQKKEAKKVFNSDLEKLKSFMEKEKKHFETFQKNLPKEILKAKSFLAAQKKEFEKVMKRLKETQVPPTKAKTKKKTAKKTNPLKDSSSGNG